MDKRKRDFDDYEASMPPPEEWRKLLSPRVGGILNPEAQIVRSNHFKGELAVLSFLPLELYESARIAYIALMSIPIISRP